MSDPTKSSGVFQDDSRPPQLRKQPCWENRRSDQMKILLRTVSKEKRARQKTKWPTGWPEPPKGWRRAPAGSDPTQCSNPAGSCVSTQTFRTVTATTLTQLPLAFFLAYIRTSYLCFFFQNYCFFSWTRVWSLSSWKVVGVPKTWKTWSSECRVRHTWPENF